MSEKNFLLTKYLLLRLFRLSPLRFTIFSKFCYKKTLIKVNKHDELFFESSLIKIRNKKYNVVFAGVKSLFGSHRCRSGGK